MNTLKTSLVTTTLVLLGGLAAPALADHTPAHGAAAKPAAHAAPHAAPKAAATPVGEAHKATHLSGTVVTASAKDHSITIKAADGEHALAVSAKASIKSGGKAIGLGDLKAGQKVEATVQSAGGKDTVEALTVTP